MSLTRKTPEPVFCLLLRVTTDYAQPITGQVTEVICPVIGWAQPELTLSRRQKSGPRFCEIAHLQAQWRKISDPIYIYILYIYTTYTILALQWLISWRIHAIETFSALLVGLKLYAQPTIRYDTWHDAHDTIHSAIHLPFSPGKQRLVIPACDQKHCTPLTTTTCAVMMRSGYNNGGLLGVSRCRVLVMNSLILLEYTDCFLWYLVFVSNFGKCYICTVSYRIVLRAYHDMYRSLCIGDIPVCRCIVSALITGPLSGESN